MEGRNCPNCGAPLEAEKNKCAYCGTSYFDLSAINIDDGEPFYLKFKTHAWNGQSIVVTALVRANPNLDITISQDPVYIESNNGRLAFPTSSYGELNMSFTTVPSHFNDKHFMVQYIDN